MRILIYTTSFAPNVGGVETYVLLLARGLAAGTQSSAPVEVTVVTRTAVNGYDDSQHLFRVARRPSLGSLISLIRQSDVIHVAGPCVAPMAIAWSIKKPFVVEHHGYQAACPNGLLLREPMKEICPGYFMQRRYGKCLRCETSERGWFGAIRNVLLTFPRRWLSSLARRNVSVSDHVARRVALTRSQVIYHGIDIAPITNRDPTQSAQPSPLEIGFIGRLVAEKGLGTLIDAARQLACDHLDFKLKFIGEGPERASLEAAIDHSDLRSRTVFTGYVTGDDFVAATTNLAVVVIPTISEETFGLAALEQMARGKLVVASNIGGLAEIVAESGLKFTPGNAMELAEILRRIIENPSILQTYAALARQRAEGFGLDRMVLSHLVLYCEILDESGNSGASRQTV